MRMVSSLKFMTKKRDMLPEEIQMRFLKRLEHFISNGYALQDALEAMAWDKDLADISSHFLFRLKEGERLELIFEETKFHSSVSAFLSFIHSNSNLREAIKKCIEVMEDRKSTRLNSSHVKISYAVFCLKKKIYKERLVKRSECQIRGYGSM